MSESPSAEHAGAGPIPGQPDCARGTFSFSRAQRLIRKADFDRVMQGGIRLIDGRLTLWVSGNGLGRTRLGLTVGRKHGHAPHRARLKRVLREAFRLCRPGLPTGLDLVCAPRAGVELCVVDCMDSFQNLTARAAPRLAGK